MFIYLSAMCHETGQYVNIEVEAPYKVDRMLYLVYV